MDHHLFVVHSWRTCIVSLSYISRAKIDRNLISFICLRSFSSTIKLLGFRVLDLDPFFAIPYIYINQPNTFWDARRLLSAIKSFCSAANTVDLPHLRDPIHQSMLFSVKHTSINFIEEGCLFPRHQFVSKIAYDDIIQKIDNVHGFFALPSSVVGLKHSSWSKFSPNFICTADNEGVSGIPLIVIEDQEIRQTLFSISADLSWNQHSLNNAIIHIGTKDECQPNILDQSLSLSSRLGLNLKKHILYCPHPSMISFGVSKFALIFHQYDVQLYNNPCIEFDLFAHSSLDLVGDSSSLAITSYRLGHKYWSIRQSLSQYLPVRNHQLDPSVQLMLNNSMTDF